MMFVEHDPPSNLDLELNKFVNNNILIMLDVAIDHIRDGFDMSSYFPRGYYKKKPEYCNDFIYSLRDTIQSSVIYDELTPIQSYVLYQIIDEWPDLYSDIPELLRYPLPEELKKKIYEERGIPFDVDPEEYQEELYIIEMLENVEAYNCNCFDDIDFLEEQVRILVERAVDGSLFMMGLDYEELDQYIEVMPMDVAERYKKFREKMSESSLVEERIIMKNVNINFNGDIIDSQIQVNTVNSTQTSTHTGAFPYEDILKVLTEVNKYRDILQADLGERGTEFCDTLDEVMRETASNGNPSKIKKALSLLKDFTVGMAGSLAAAGVHNLLMQIHL